MSTIEKSDEETPSPTPIEPGHKARAGRRLQFDEHGHAIPLTEAEMAEYKAEALLALKELASIPDDPNESDEEFWRAMDEGRPERPLLQGILQVVSNRFVLLACSGRHRGCSVLRLWMPEDPRPAVLLLHRYQMSWHVRRGSRG